jgi:mannan endo-1,4-beta-mannosidase
MDKITFLLIALFIAVFNACSSSFIQKENFIKVEGTHFTINSLPYYFVGTNLWYGAYLGADDSSEGRERLIYELDSLKKIGINNLRILAASEMPYIEKTLYPPIQSKPNVINEKLLEGLDFFLNELNKRNMYAVLFLNNYWEWSGGFVVYNKWSGFGNLVDPYRETDGWRKFMNSSAEFYRNEEGNKIFQNFIKTLVERKNVYSGKYYYEDQSIMSWELANEPRSGADTNSIENQKYFYKWIDTTAKFIKSLDPYHLITTGSEGVIGCLQVDSIFINAHQSNYIDYLTFHLWPKNWGWFNAKKAEETFDTAVKNATEYFDNHIKLAKKINKPIVLEEFGLSRDNEECSSSSTTFFRNKYFDKIYEIIFDSAKAGSPIAGSNFWGWSGRGRSQRKNYVWQLGDAFLADPPQEPQGFNSVFDSDISTINIIKAHSMKMNSLNKTE